MTTARFMAFGDIHGKLDAMYQTAVRWEEQHGKDIDAILQVGDFESIRTEEDYAYYFAPAGKHERSDFGDYYAGHKKAPFLTIFTAGNHEAWGALKPHNKGGFICPNIYYLGRSGILPFKGVTIGGLSGLYQAKYYQEPLPEEPSDEWKYYRKDDVERLKQRESLDILLFHEWIRPYSALQVEEDDGVPPSFKANRIHSPAYDLVKTLRPAQVLMGHMNSSVRATLGDSRVIGLKPVYREKENPQSYCVIEIPGGVITGLMATSEVIPGESSRRE